MSSLPQDSPEKQCGRCKFPLPHSAFAKDRNSKDGLQDWCKVCRKQHYESRKEKISAQRRTDEYREANRLDKRARYHADKENSQERMRRYRREHPETMQAIEKRRRENHKNVIAERKKQWQQSDTYKEYQKVYRKEYRQTEKGQLIARTTRHKRRAQKHTSAHYTAAQVLEQVERQKRKCYYCKAKFADGKRAYHIEHIVPLSRGGSNTIENIVLACPHCNLSKSDKLPHEWPDGGRLL